MNNLNEIYRILENMDQTDSNVITIKKLLDSYTSGSKIYMLSYKDKPLHFTVDSNEDVEYCNDTRVALTTNDYDPVWTTTDIRIAAYVKYYGTEWYNSSIEQPEHHYKPEELEIVDTMGNVYNRKPIKIKTKAIIYSKLFNDSYLIEEIKRDSKIADIPLSFYEQTYFLQEVKEKIQRRKGKLACSKMNRGQLYEYRKDLVTAKGELLKAGKSVDKIQKKLDSVNKKIVKLGGR